MIGPKRLIVVGFVSAAGAPMAIAQGPATPVLVVLVSIAGFGGIGTQNHYPADVRANGLGWALAVGRLGAIAGPAFGAWATGGSAPLQATATAFGCAALAGAGVMAVTRRRSGAWLDEVADPAIDRLERQVPAR